MARLFVKSRLKNPIRKAHVNTEHGGRNKIIYYAIDKLIIPKDGYKLFCCLDNTCNRERV